MTTAGTTGAEGPEPYRWPPARDFTRAEHPAYRIFLLLAALGTFGLVWSVISEARQFPITLAYTAGWLVWGLLAYALVTRADLNLGVPGRVRFAAVFWGVLSPVYADRLVAGFAELVPMSDRWSAAVHTPLPEEGVKLVGVVLIAFVAPAAFSRPLGALTVGMLVGLGFTILTNLDATNAVLGTGNDVPLDALLAWGGYGAPWAHLLFTGVAALGVWCVVAFRRQPWTARFVVAVACGVLAVLLHFLQAALGPVFDRGAGRGSAVPWNEWSRWEAWGEQTPGAWTVGFWLAELLLLLALVLWARRIDRAWFGRFTAQGLPPLLDPAEAASLRTRRSRRRARRAGAACEVQQAQLRYVNAVGDGDDSTAQDMVHRVRLLRIGTENPPH